MKQMGRRSKTQDYRRGAGSPAGIVIGFCQSASQTVQYSNVPQEPIRSLSPVCLVAVTAAGDALSELRSWNNWEVVQGKNILPGVDCEAAASHTADIRLRLVQAYLKSIRGLATRERELYGMDVFSRLHW